MDACIDINDGLNTLTGDLQSRPCKIAFLGNSVTAQKESYAKALAARINEFYPHTHEYIYAGIGGVGSLASCFLMDDFVLRHEPDICLVECTVADIGYATPGRHLKPAIEGMIQKLISAGVRTLFLHLYSTHTTPERADEVISAYEEVLGNYRIASINVRESIISGILTKSLESTDILYDGVHTTGLGAKTYADVIFKALDSTPCDATDDHGGFNTGSDRSFRHTRIVLPESLLNGNSENLTASSFRGLIKCVRMVAGHTLETSIHDGMVVGFLIIADEDSGVLHVSYGDNSLEIQTHDRWCHRERIQAVLLEEPVRESQRLAISLSSAETAPRGANGTTNDHIKKGSTFRMIGLMVSYAHQPLLKSRLW